MDKRIIFAVAGSGKTSYILDHLEKDNRVLLLTYTENNYRNLKTRVIKKFGYLPENIKIYKYFTFLYSFCYKPLLHSSIRAKGFYWDRPPQSTVKLSRTNIEYYVTEGRRLYHNRLAKLLCSEESLNSVKKRLEKYFDLICVDEIQDFAGHDFDFFLHLTGANIDALLVGDFYQHTFDTSRDGRINEDLHNDYHKYIERFKKAGLVPDMRSLVKSYRCSPNICSFVSNNLGIQIFSHRQDETSVVIVEDEQTAEELFSCPDTIKLFYKEHYRYNGYSDNWAKCKGLDQFGDVCVVLNKSCADLLTQGKLESLNTQTKNKLYVACTRAKGNLYLLPPRFAEKHKQT